MATCATCRKSWGEGVESCPEDGTALLPDELVAGTDATLPPGTLVGDYKIEKKIGEGAYGTVYAAEHPVIGKRAAIKVLNRRYSSDIGIVSRFVTEARAVNRIRHPNIVDIFAFGQIPSPQGDQHYLAMELLDGTPLEQLLREKGPLRLTEALPILRGVAEALDAAHQHGIVHRDLKPDNIFLVREKGPGGTATWRPKLLDFGVAKLHADGESSHKTATGIAIGTPYYMSPEQCRGKKVEASSDIYALGAVIYQVLTGRPPFEGESVMDVLMKHMNDTPPPMSEIDPRLGGLVDGAVAAMLAKKPKARPASATAAVELLADAAASVAVISGAQTVAASVALEHLGAATVATPTPVSTPSIASRSDAAAVPQRSVLTAAASTPVLDHVATGDTLVAPPNPGSTLRSPGDDSGERHGPETPHISIAGGPKGTTLGAISAPSGDRSAALGLRVGVGLGAIAALGIAFILLKTPASEPTSGSPAVTSAPVAPAKQPEPTRSAPPEPVTVVGPVEPAASSSAAAPPPTAPVEIAKPKLGGPLKPPPTAKPPPKPSASAPAKPPPRPPGGGILDARD